MIHRVERYHQGFHLLQLQLTHDLLDLVTIESVTEELEDFFESKFFCIKVSFDIKNLLKLPLYFSRVKQAPEQEIDEPISVFVNLILDSCGYPF